MSANVKIEETITKLVPGGEPDGEQQDECRDAQPGTEQLAADGDPLRVGRGS